MAAAEFNRLVVQMAGNVTLALFLGMLDELYLRHLTRFVDQARPDQLTLNKAVHATHSQLVESIARQDGNGTEIVWRYHVQRSREVVLAELGEHTPIAIY